MSKAIIRLAYRLRITVDAATPFEQKVFQATWLEFRVQQQSFAKGQDLLTWEAIKTAFPKSDPTLPFKVSFSIGGLIRSLNQRIPGLFDNLGMESVPFIQHKMELISSHIEDPTAHSIALTFYSGELPFYEIIDDYILIGQEPPSTFLLKIQPGLSIISYHITTPEFSLAPS